MNILAIFLSVALTCITASANSVDCAKPSSLKELETCRLRVEAQKRKNEADKQRAKEGIPSQNTYNDSGAMGQLAAASNTTGRDNPAFDSAKAIRDHANNNAGRRQPVRESNSVSIPVYQSE